MPTYKDAERGTWYVDVRYQDNAGRSQRKKKRGFKTQREAKAWEREFLLAKHGDENMPFATLCKLYIDNAQAAGIKVIRVHDLRHSHASMLIEMDVPILLIAQRLGHEDVDTTLRVYSHLYPSRIDGTIAKMEKLHNCPHTVPTEQTSDRKNRMDSDN